ncbi:hypothetical protein ACFQ1I_10875 [Kitasatospora arboriphila]
MTAPATAPRHHHGREFGGHRLRPGRLRPQGGSRAARTDAAALLMAAESGFPRWVWVLQNVRPVVVFGAAALALTTLALA